MIISIESFKYTEKKSKDAKRWARKNKQLLFGLATMLCTILISKSLIVLIGMLDFRNFHEKNFLFDQIDNVDLAAHIENIKLPFDLTFTDGSLDVFLSGIHNRVVKIHTDDQQIKNGKDLSIKKILNLEYNKNFDYSKIPAWYHQENKSFILKFKLTVQMDIFGFNIPYRIYKLVHCNIGNEKNLKSFMTIERSQNEIKSNKDSLLAVFNIRFNGFSKTMNIRLLNYHFNVRLSDFSELKLYMEKDILKQNRIYIKTSFLVNDPASNEFEKIEDNAIFKINTVSEMSLEHFRNVKRHVLDCLMGNKKAKNLLVSLDVPFFEVNDIEIINKEIRCNLRTHRRFLSNFINPEMAFNRKNNYPKLEFIAKEGKIILGLLTLENYEDNEYLSFKVTASNLKIMHLLSSIIKPANKILVIEAIGHTLLDTVIEDMQFIWNYRNNYTFTNKGVLKPRIEKTRKNIDHPEDKINIDVSVEKNENKKHFIKKKFILPKKKKAGDFIKIGWKTLGITIKDDVFDFKMDTNINSGSFVILEKMKNSIECFRRSEDVEFIELEINLNLTKKKNRPLFQKEAICCDLSVEEPSKANGFLYLLINYLYDRFFIIGKNAIQSKQPETESKIKIEIGSVCTEPTDPVSFVIPFNTLKNNSEKLIKVLCEKKGATKLLSRIFNKLNLKFNKFIQSDGKYGISLLGNYKRGNVKDKKLAFFTVNFDVCDFEIIIAGYNEDKIANDFVIINSTPIKGKFEFYNDNDYFVAIDGLKATEQPFELNMLVDLNPINDFVSGGLILAVSKKNETLAYLLGFLLSKLTFSNSEFPSVQFKSRGLQNLIKFSDSLIDFDINVITGKEFSHDISLLINLPKETLNQKNTKHNISGADDYTLSWKNIFISIQAINLSKEYASISLKNGSLSLRADKEIPLKESPAFSMNVKFIEDIFTVENVKVLLAYDDVVEKEPIHLDKNQLGALKTLISHIALPKNKQKEPEESDIAKSKQRKEILNNLNIKDNSMKEWFTYIIQNLYTQNNSKEITLEHYPVFRKYISELILNNFEVESKSIENNQRKKTNENEQECGFRMKTTFIAPYALTLMKKFEHYLHKISLNSYPTQLNFRMSWTTSDDFNHGVWPFAISVSNCKLYLNFLSNIPYKELGVKDEDIAQSINMEAELKLNTYITNEAKSFSFKKRQQGTGVNLFTLSTSFSDLKLRSRLDFSKTPKKFKEEMMKVLTNVYVKIKDYVANSYIGSMCYGAYNYIKSYFVAKTPVQNVSDINDTDNCTNDEDFYNDSKPQDVGFNGEADPGILRFKELVNSEDLFIDEAKILLYNLKYAIVKKVELENSYYALLLLPLPLYISGDFNNDLYLTVKLDKKVVFNIFIEKQYGKEIIKKILIHVNLASACISLFNESLGSTCVEIFMNKRLIFRSKVFQKSTVSMIMDFFISSLSKTDTKKEKGEPITNEKIPLLLHVFDNDDKIENSEYTRIKKVLDSIVKEI